MPEIYVIVGAVSVFAKSTVIVADVPARVALISVSAVSVPKVFSLDSIGVLCCGLMMKVKKHL